MFWDPFNPTLFSSQGRNPTWGRPVRKSRPQRSLSPSCSSLPSGRWRTSSMSLHWSSSSLSGHMQSEKRMGSSTCWHKTSSMRKSTPKTKKKDLFVEEHGGVRCTLKKKRKTRLLVTVWLVCTCDWEHKVLLQKQSASDAAIRLVTALFFHVCASQQFASAGCVPSSPHGPQLPFTSISKVVCAEGFCRHMSGDGLSYSWSDLDSWSALLFSDPDKTFSLALYCLVVFDCVLILYYGCLLYVKMVTFFMVKTTSPCLATTTNLKRF